MKASYSFGALEYGVHIEAKTAHAGYHVFMTLTIQELNMMHQI